MQPRDFARLQPSAHDFHVPVKYRVLKLVGQGTFSTVCEATCITETPDGEVEEKMVAIKKIPFFNKHTGMAKQVLKELEILHHFQAVGQVVECHDAFISSPPPDDGAPTRAEHSHNNHQEDVYLVMDYVQTDLSNLFRGDQIDSEDLVRSLVCQLLLGLAPMHSRNCTHRDLNCKNVLVGHTLDVYICGFGFARCYDSDEQMERGVVTQWYRAPEVLSDAAYTSTVDIWAVGVMMAEILTRQHLFPGRNSDVVDQFKKILDLVGAPDAAWFAAGGGTLSSSTRPAKAFVQKYIDHMAAREAAATKKAEEDAVAAKKATQDAAAAKTEEGAIALKKAEEQAVAAKKAHEEAVVAKKSAFRQNFALPQVPAQCLLHLLAHYPFIVYLAYSIWRKLLVSSHSGVAFLERLQLKIELSDDGKDFLKKMLRFNPDTRMSAADALAHPWIQNSNFAETVADCLEDHQNIPHLNFNRALVPKEEPGETQRVDQNLPPATHGPELGALNAAIREIVRRIHTGEEASGSAATAGGSTTTFQSPAVHALVPGAVYEIAPASNLNLRVTGAKGSNSIDLREPDAGAGQQFMVHRVGRQLVFEPLWQSGSAIETTHRTSPNNQGGGECRIWSHNALANNDTRFSVTTAPQGGLLVSCVDGLHWAVEGGTKLISTLGDGERFIFIKSAAIRSNPEEAPGEAAPAPEAE